MIQASLENGTNNDHLLKQVNKSLLNYSERNSFFNFPTTASAPSQLTTTLLCLKSQDANHRSIKHNSTEH